MRILISISALDIGTQFKKTLGKGLTEGGGFDGSLVGNDRILVDGCFHHVGQMGNHWSMEVKIEDSPTIARKIRTVSE